MEEITFVYIILCLVGLLGSITLILAVKGFIDNL